MSDPTVGPQLDYAPPQPAIRRWLRRFRWFIVLSLIGASAIWWGPPLKRRVELRYWFEQCAGHTPSAGQVVWDESGLRTALSPTSYRPKAWTEFYSRQSPPGSNAYGSIFLGELRTPKGKRVLVSVESMSTPWTPIADRFNPYFVVRVFDAGGFSGLPRQLVDTTKIVPLPPHSSLQMLAGQRDPNDPTRFAIPFGTPGNPIGFVNGYIKDGGIDLEVDFIATQQVLKSPG